MTQRFETRHTAKLENLPALREFVAESCRKIGADDAICFALKLAADEACANIILHGYTGREPGPINLTISGTPQQVIVTINDFGHSLAPEAVPTPDLQADWQERRMGGLGWHLIQQVADEIKYTSDAQAGNFLTLTKRLNADDQHHRRDGMEISFDHRDPVTVAAIAGSVDALTAPHLTEALSKIIAEGHIRLVADFSQVDYTSSAGLRALLGTLKEARAQGGDLRLAGVQENVRKVLELSGFTSILKFFPDAAAAIASFGG